MKTRFRFFSLFISSISFVCAIQAQSFSLKQSHENGIYKSGDLIRITASPGPNTTDTLWVKILKNNNQVIYEKAIVPEFDDIVIYESAFKEPCSVIAEAKMNGKKQAIGMIVDPLKIKTGTKYPKDFQKYWNTEKQNLKTLRMDIKLHKADTSEQGFACFDTEINCTGPNLHVDISPSLKKQPQNRCQ